MVIRFLPDGWWDVLMRPLDMLSPEGNVYVEVAAPDLRLAAALLLAVVVLACGRRVQADRRPAFVLLGLVLVAMVPWFLTTGNGRYFIPILLLLGPLCIGFVRLLPFTRPMKFAIAALLLAGQGFLVAESSPWGSWGLAYWRDGPYFAVSNIPAEPRSYVSITPISYSLIAPQFPAGSRWMNVLSGLGGIRERTHARKWLADSKALWLIAPSIPSAMTDDHQPTAGVIRVFDNLVKGRGLSVIPGAHCDFMPSKGLVATQVRGESGAERDPEFLSKLGFWACPVRYDPAGFTEPSAGKAAPDPADPVFEAVERMCPRFFPPGEAPTQRMEGGATRHYAASDTRVYVMDDGEVLYKFWRSINAVTIGRRDDILANKVPLDCTAIRAPNWRKGGP